MNTTHEFATGSPSATGRATSFSLRRPTHDRLVGGVCSGVAEAFGIDALVVRIGFVVLTLVGLAGIPLYLAGWLLIPDERSGQSIAAQLIQSVSSHSN